MREETKLLIGYYGITNNMDWMNFYIKDVNNLQFHHIVKKSDGGKMTLTNGAMLTPDAHRFLHTIERYDIEIYNMIKRMFKLYVMQKASPNEEQRELMQSILNVAYLRFENAKTKKGKPIIKERFKNR